MVCYGLFMICVIWSTCTSLKAKDQFTLGSGCGSVGRVVAYDTRGLQFDSSHQQNFIEHLFVNVFIINCIENTKINKKRPGIAHFLKAKDQFTK